MRPEDLSSQPRLLLLASVLAMVGLLTEVV